MPCSIVFTKHADNDLLDIWAFIAADNPNAADKMLTGLLTQIEGLADYPQTGRPVRQISPSHRVLVYRNYLTVYDFDDEQRLITVARIFHAARDWMQLFDKDE